MFPFTIVALCWCKLLGLCQCRRVICDLLCCAKRRKKRKELRERNAERSRSLRQSELAFLGPSATPPPPSTLITDLALTYRPHFRHQVRCHVQAEGGRAKMGEETACHASQQADCRAAANKNRKRCYPNWALLSSSVQTFILI